MYVVPPRSKLSKHEGLLLDIIGPDMKEWPASIVKLVRSRTIPNDRQRFTLVVFFLTNGVDPVLIKEWFSLKYRLNAHQNQQIDRVIAQFPTSNWKAWNVSLGKTV